MLGFLEAWLGERKRMLRIKRTKPGPPTVQVKNGQRMEVPGAVAVHYATAVSPRGAIEGLSSNPAHAVAVTQAVAKRVQAFYAGRANVGELEFEPIDATAPQLAEAVAAEDAVGAEEFAKLQAECRRLQAENAALEQRLEEAAQAVASGKKELADVTSQLTRLRDLEAKWSDNGKLTARILELEAELAKATEAGKVAKKK
jgi:hypothetical protein